jgi:hypothetical protein
VRAALTSIRHEMTTLAGEPSVTQFYARENIEAPLLRIVSPLALGSDRLVAEEALALGYKLYVPMPFSRAEYERDFHGTDHAEAPDAVPVTAEEDLRQFQELLARADQDWMSLDGDYHGKTHGGRDEDWRDRAYEAVGRFVVRNSDIVIAIWNGERAAGRGGTQEIIDYATKVGVPVWWIHATKNTEPCWITDSLDTRDLSALPPAAAMISPYLKLQILGPKSIQHNRETGIAHIAQFFQSKKANPAKVYFKERPRQVALEGADKAAK